MGSTRHAFIKTAPDANSSGKRIGTGELKIVKMKLSVIIITLLHTFSCAYAQDAEQIDHTQFSKFIVNDHISIVELVTLESNWAFLKDSLGDPLTEDCKDGDAFMGIKPHCSFTYDGLEIDYISVGNGVELSSIKMTNDSAYLMYENVELRVGDSISKIAPFSLKPIITGGK